LGIAVLVQGHLADVEGLRDSPHARLLADDRKKALGGWALRDMVYRRIQKLLGEARVPVVPLKGIDFAMRLYDCGEARTMSDIDVLVPEKEYFRTVSRLAEEKDVELEPFRHGRGAWARSSKDRHLLFRVGRHKIMVELHRRLGQRHHLRVDYGKVWGRTVEESGGRVLATEDSLLHTAYHLQNHMLPTRLMWLVDLEAIVVQLRPDWEIVVERARAWGMATGLWHALRRMEATLGVEIVPGWVLSELAPGELRGRYLDRLVPPGALETPLDGLGVRRTQLLWWLPLMDRWSQRMRFVSTYGAMRVAHGVERRVRGMVRDKN